MSRQTTVDALELKKLLCEIKNRRPDIGVRFRVMGERWINNFMYVKKISGRSLVLADGRTETSLLIRDLNAVMQFEIEQNFYKFAPHFHYDVIPSHQIDNTPDAVAWTDYHPAAGSRGPFR